MSLSKSDCEFFRNKKPNNTTKRNLLIIFFLGIFFGSSIYFYNYIFRRLDENSNLPEIKILCEEDLSTDEMADCTIELNCEDESCNLEPIKAKIKIRGGLAGVSSYPKKGYRLKLSQDISLLGMRKEDDWNLYALYLDFPRMRIKFASDLWGSLKPTNPTAVSVDSKYVSLYFNGEYIGLYLLSERYNRKLFGLDDAQNNVNSSLIFQAKGRCSLAYQNQGRWEQDWPNDYEDYDIMDQVLGEITHLITNTSDDSFFDPDEGIFSKFSKINLIDFFIFNFFIDHRDFWHTNYYIVRDSYPNQFFLIPCDYDGCLGQYKWNLYDVEAETEQTVRTHNYLFTRLLNNNLFRQDCKNRWIKLRNTLWTEEYLLDEIYEIYDEIKDEIKRDTLIWFDTVQDYCKDDYADDVEEYIERLFEYIPKRLEFCDTYFENF